MVVDDLSFSYEGGESIFSSFSLSLERGEHLLVLSPPGSGKSTLAKILTGSVPAYSDGKLSGQITVDGKDLLSISIPERMEIVSRISQNTDEMLLFSTVEEEIIFPLSNMGLPWPEIERRYDAQARQNDQGYMLFYRKKREGEARMWRGKEEEKKRKRREKTGKTRWGGK